eukprot:CAMPEP_0185259956 /NCGR_PEP_ID=MMETSP1359-20130426/8632_1 /TAXON_ID=552665 /ORGANISM="Bigelowiella longifila, Strain CCMP242" /LENGTH=180 /DNA_ID=CAMNT_0027846035 /DNA_START=136 /DNA_END=679 /DNA_ORIENTATION=-
MALYFCSKNEKRDGIRILLEATKRGHLDSTYDAALILRKCNPAISSRLLKRASFLGHMPSSIEQGHRHIDKIIDETKMNPVEVFQKQQEAAIYSFMTEFFMQNSNLEHGVALDVDVVGLFSIAALVYLSECARVATLRDIVVDCARSYRGIAINSTATAFQSSDNNSMFSTKTSNERGGQ